MTFRHKILAKLQAMALTGSVSAAKLYLQNTVPEDDSNLSTGQTIALIRDTMRTIDAKNSKKIST